MAAKFSDAADALGTSDAIEQAQRLVSHPDKQPTQKTPEKDAVSAQDKEIKGEATAAVEASPETVEAAEEPQNGASSTAVDAAAPGKDLSAELLLSQLKELTDSVKSSFDQISATMEEIRGKATALASLGAAMLDPQLQTNGGKFSDKDIDARLMLLEVAQQAQESIKQREDEAYSAASSAAAAVSAAVTGTANAATAVASQSSVPSGPAHSASSLGPPGVATSSYARHSPPKRHSEPELPEIDLNPRAKCVYDVYDEWHEGYRGQPPLVQLEGLYGTKWRRGRIAKSAQRRKKLIEFIEAEAKRFPNKSEEEVVDALEKYRRVQRKGLFWLYSQLPKRLFDEQGNLDFEEPPELPEMVIDEDDDEEDEDLHDAADGDIHAAKKRRLARSKHGTLAADPVATAAAAVIIKVGEDDNRDLENDSESDSHSGEDAQKTDPRLTDQ